MKTITDFGALIFLAGAFGLFSACVAQGDPASETSSMRMATGVSPAGAAADPELLTMAPLPAGEKVSLQADTFPPPCGICSDFSCQTHSLGARCATSSGPPGNLLGTCQDRFSTTCSQDGETRCSCVKLLP
jgi:hypothetical protein